MEHVRRARNSKSLILALSGYVFQTQNGDTRINSAQSADNVVSPARLILVLP